MSIQKTLDQLKKDEGFMPKPYKCSEGVDTFGHGLTWITKEESESLLKNRVATYISELVTADLRRMQTMAFMEYERENSFFIHQPEEIQSVMINMAYNLGVNGILTFKKTLGFIAERRFSQAAKEMLDSKWADQVGERAKRLSREVFDCDPDSERGKLIAGLEALSNDPYRGRFFKLLEDLNDLASGSLQGDK